MSETGMLRQREGLCGLQAKALPLKKLGSPQPKSSRSVRPVFTPKSRRRVGRARVPSRPWH